MKTELALVRFASSVSWLLDQFVKESQITVHNWKLVGNSRDFPYCQYLEVDCSSVEGFKTIKIPLPHSFSTIDFAKCNVKELLSAVQSK